MTIQQAAAHPETIRDRCAAIRQEWTPSERCRRRHAANAAADRLLRQIQAGQRQLATA